jgi:hypothetical protein
MERIDSDVCEHPAFEPERYLGTLTSEYICVRCGLSVSYEHAMYLLDSKKEDRKRSVA